VENSKLALIIDDDEDLCQMLKAILGSKFSTIKLAHTLESGKKLINQLVPDVIFLDNNLPDGSGISLIKDIKGVLPSSTIILITAMDNFREQAIEYGADVFLEKPLTYTSIVNALSKASEKA
jgi:two-component system OmpR family response regulator